MTISGGEFLPGDFPTYGHESHSRATDWGPDRGENLDHKPRVGIGLDASGNSEGISNSQLSMQSVPDPEKWQTDPGTWVGSEDPCEDFNDAYVCK